ncbi:RCC1 domain-containing protein [Methanocella conradii]|uniref:RCC1 domain-containing protein n=1 Tax=Methanocella conradii TaxID=1175444 RepID=UPI0024B3990A|nr:hypothetical protein [Methanocella conradii]MDI6897487.1 hypothetical protein [Methanocella conradii]
MFGNKRFMVYSALLAILVASSLGSMSCPADSAGAQIGVKKVAVGLFHTVALADDGTVWAWGSNTYGECGEGSSDDILLKPVMVGRLTGVKDVAVGNNFSMALKSDGTVWTWGDNRYGQLGIGTADDGRHPEPVQVPGLTNVIAISADFQLAMALKDDGTIWAWGSNSYGQLGDGKPIDIPPPLTYSKEWDMQNKPSPVMVSGLDHVVSIDASGWQAFAVKDDGTVWGWGQNMCTLGEWSKNNENSLYTSTPVQIVGLTDVKKACCLGRSAVALKKDGTVWAWGEDRDGVLGNGEVKSYPDVDKVYNPIQVIELTDIVDISCGGAHSLALKDDGTVWAWGKNYAGQLGDSTNESRGTPFKVPIPAAKAIFAGYYSNVIIDKDNNVWAWGMDDYGQLGDGEHGELLYRTTPKKVLLSFGGSPTIVPTATSTPGPMASPSTIAPTPGTSPTMAGSPWYDALPIVFFIVVAAITGLLAYIFLKRRN